MMNKKLNFLLALIALFVFYSCEDNEVISEFVAIPETEFGERLVSTTGLVASISKDTTYALSEGVQVTEFGFLSDKGQAMQLFFTQIDLTAGVKIEASMPDGKRVFGMQPMTIQAENDEDANRVLGGVNADFYNMDTGVPRGVFIADEEIIKNHFDTPTWNFFGIDKQGKAVIAGNDQFDLLKDDMEEAVGAGVRLLAGGEYVASAAPQEPRTAVGIDQDGTTVFFLVVDGRNWSYSNGMDYADLAAVLQAGGAYDAVNLDGGGSSTFFIKDTQNQSDGPFVLRNWPSDRGGAERAVANGLLIISDK